MPTRISMIRPMPFWPSLEPCEKLTPVQVITSRQRIQVGGGSLPAAGRKSSGRRISSLARANSRAAATNPASGEMSRERPTCLTWCQLMPAPLSRIELARPTPDGADQRVRTGGGKREIPGAEVPDDRRRQQREDHREAGV